MAKKKLDRMAAIAKATGAVTERAARAERVDSPFDPSYGRVQGQLRGARTGWNPNPGVAPVREWRPEPASPQPATPAAPSPAARRPRRSDAILDRAKARVAASAPTMPPPSGAVTGPKLRPEARQPRPTVGPRIPTTAADFVGMPRPAGASIPPSRPMRASPGSASDLAFAGVKPPTAAPRRPVARGGRLAPLVMLGGNAANMLAPTLERKKRK